MSHVSYRTSVDLAISSNQGCTAALLCWIQVILAQVQLLSKGKAKEMQSLTQNTRPAYENLTSYPEQYVNVSGLVSSFWTF